MYTAREVSYRIIAESHAKEHLVSNLKLQKLLYLVQAYFLVELGYPCFREEIEAWDFGPVVPCVYHEFKQFGSASIYLPQDVREAWTSSGNEEYVAASVCKEIEALVTVVGEYAPYSSTELTRLTLSQTPWYSAIRSPTNIITHQSLIDYFSD